MSQVPCVLHKQDDEIDYTPVSDVTAGDVVVLGTRLITIAPRDIAANILGSVTRRGMFTVPKDSSTVSQGEALYWDNNGNPVDGDAGTGAFSDNSALGPFAGWAGNSAATGVATVDLSLDSMDAGATVLRSSLGQDDLAVYRIPLNVFGATDSAQAKLGASAGTPSGAFGITVGTHGTNAPKVVGEAASNNSKTDKMRVQYTLPPEYVAGETVTLRVKCKETVGAATVSTSIDAEVYKVAAEAGLDGSPTDICATSAQDVTTSVGNKDFTITATSLVPGDELDIELTGVTNDTGGAVGTILNIYDVSLLLDVKG